MMARSALASTFALTLGFGVLLAGVPLAPTAAGAAEIKVMAPRAIWTILNDAGPAFERATGHKINVSVDLAAVVVRRVNQGEAFDIAVATPQQIDALVKDGKLIADTRADLTKAGIGVEVKKGAPKPDIATVDAFKRAMLAAKTIGYLKIGTSGQMVADALKKIGLTDAVKDKLILPEDDVVSEMVAEGKIEIGMVNISQILTTAGVDLVGPLPADIQSYIVFSGGVNAKSANPDAARALMKFFKEGAVPTIKAQGMEPG
jgi:molybdate transport system substrate-binding protein